MDVFDDNKFISGVLERERVLAVFREIFSNQSKYQLHEYVALIEKKIEETFGGKIAYLRLFNSLDIFLDQEIFSEETNAEITNKFKKISTITIEHNNHYYLIKKLNKDYLIGKTTNIFYVDNLLHLLFCFIDKIDFIETENKRNLKNIVEALSSALESRDNYTLGHSKNVASYAYAIALSYYGLFYRANEASFSRTWQSLSEKEFADRIRIAGLLHDIGKVGMDDFLKSPDKPNDDQFNHIKTHIRDSMEIISRIKEYDRIEISKIANQHHEKWDGNGYIGLNGKNIHIGARIISIADSFDAMTTNRSYRNKLSWCYAVDELRTNSMLREEPWYDPEVYFAFEESIVNDIGNEPNERYYGLINASDAAYEALRRFRDGLNADSANPDQYRERYKNYDNSIKCYKPHPGIYIKCSHYIENLLTGRDHDKMKSIAIVKKMEDANLMESFIEALKQATIYDGKAIGYYGEHLVIISKDEYKELYNIICKTIKVADFKITAVIFKANTDDFHDAVNCIDKDKLKDGQICCLGPLCVGNRDNCLC